MTNTISLTTFCLPCQYASVIAVDEYMKAPGRHTASKPCDRLKFPTYWAIIFHKWSERLQCRLVPTITCQVVRSLRESRVQSSCSSRGQAAATFIDSTSNPIHDSQYHPLPRQPASNHHNGSLLESRRSHVRFAPHQLGPRTPQLTKSAATTATSRSHRASFADPSRKTSAFLLSAGV